MSIDKLKLGRGLKDNDKRKFPGERGPRPDFAKLKREEATERQAYYSSLTTQAKIAHVIRRNATLSARGHIGQSARELARLEAQFAKEQTEAAVVPKPQSGKKAKRAA